MSSQAQIIDMSPAGARIRTPAQLKPGDVLEFESADESRPAPQYLVAWTGRKGSDLEGEIGLRVLMPKTG